MLLLAAVAQEYHYIENNASYNQYTSNDFIELCGYKKSISIISFYRCYSLCKISENELIEEKIHHGRKCDLCDHDIIHGIRIDYFCFHIKCAKACINIMNKVINNEPNDYQLICKDFLNTTKSFIHSIIKIPDYLRSYMHKIITYDNKYIECYAIGLFTHINIKYNIYDLLSGVNNTEDMPGLAYINDNGIEIDMTSCHMCSYGSDFEYYPELEIHLCARCKNNIIKFKNDLIKKFMYITYIYNTPEDIIKLIISDMLKIYDILHKL